MSSLEGLDLVALAAAVKAGALAYEQVQAEWSRRKAHGLDPSTGAPPVPVQASAAIIPAIACPHCGSLSRAPIAPGEPEITGQPEGASCR